MRLQENNSFSFVTYYEVARKKIRQMTVRSWVIFVLWLLGIMLLCMGIAMHQYADKISKFSAELAFFVHIAILLPTFKIYGQANKQDRKVLIWFVILNIGLSINSLTFYVLVYLKNTMLTNIHFAAFLLNFLPVMAWLMASIVFLAKMSWRKIINSENVIKIAMFFGVINIIAIFSFLSAIHYAFSFFSWQSVSQIVLVCMQLLIFDGIIICLIYSENKGLSYFLIGLTILISGNLFVVYSVASQTVTHLVYGQLLRSFGLLLMMMGVWIMEKDKIYPIQLWFRAARSIRNRLAWWAFGISVSSFLLFFIMEYFFAIIDATILLGLPFFLMLYSVVVVVFAIFLGKKLEAPFKKMENNIRILKFENANSKTVKLDDSFSSQEFIFLHNFIVDAFAFKEASIAQERLTALAAQVAHDIRSPLAALNTSLKLLPPLADNQRILMRNAANRINDIAHNLLQQYSNVENKISSHLRVELLAPILESIISEKRLQFLGEPIFLEAEISMEGVSAFAEIDPQKMKRLLSNLINNAAEAIFQKEVNITVTLNIQDDHIDIQIIDNGRGIPVSRLQEVLKVGVSFKEGGSGLGLSHAKETIESWGGALQLHSTEEKGTVVHIQLPCAPSPKWFISNIMLIPDATIAILDDDQSVHNAWRQRLYAVSSEFKIHHFTVPQLFVEWYQKQSLPVQVFSDYELLGHIETGLDVLEMLKVGNRGVLVTSHYESQEIITRCQLLEVSVLPKNLLAYIQIEVISPPELIPLDLILIDDDITICQCWRFFADIKGKSIQTFRTIVAFEAILPQVDTTTPIYIDSELASGIKGEEYAEQLFKRGFHEIYLVTGYPATQFNEMPWIRAIIDKSPPFM